MNAGRTHPGKEGAALIDLSVADALALLALQIEWGADEALDELPLDRLAAPAAGLVPRNLQAVVEIAPPVRAEAPPPRPPVISRPPLRSQVQQAEELAAAAGDIGALRAAVTGFTGCSLRDTASHTLFLEGDAAVSESPEAGSPCGLMLIGEVPDADEDRAGHCFAGPSGILLDRMLASIGLSRSQILIAPLIPWRPPGDRKPSPVEMAACLPFLHRLVVLARPKRLILMGVRPTRALLANETPIARLRGHWLPAAVQGLHAPIQALPMRHPGHLLANPLSRRDAWHDLLRLRNTLDTDLSQAREAVRE